MATPSFGIITCCAMKSKLPTNEMLLKDVVAARKQIVRPYEEKAIASSLMSAALSPGKITSESTNEKLGTTELTLSNGVTVTLKPTTLKNNEILVNAIRLGGWHKFPLQDKDNAKHATEIVTEMGIKDMRVTILASSLCILPKLVKG